MANVHEIGPAQNAETERLRMLVQSLQDECARLRQDLAKTEAERDQYLKGLYENARKIREFEDVDIPSLEAMSGGPVEMIE